MLLKNFRSDLSLCLVNRKEKFRHDCKRMRGNKLNVNEWSEKGKTHNYFTRVPVPAGEVRCQECFWGHFGALVLWRFGAPHQLVGAWCCWCRGLLVQIRRTLLVPTWLIVTKSRHRRRPLSTCWILSNAHVAKIRTGNGGRFVFCAVEMVVVILDLRLCVWFKRIGGRNIAKEIQTEIQR